VQDVRTGLSAHRRGKVGLEPTFRLESSSDDAAHVAGALGEQVGAVADLQDPDRCRDGPRPVSDVSIGPTTR
jgi:hypothetical protein